MSYRSSTLGEWRAECRFMSALLRVARPHSVHVYLVVFDDVVSRGIMRSNVKERGEIARDRESCRR